MQHNHKPGVKCPFCTPVKMPVLDKNGKPTDKTRVVHDVTRPHPSVFGFGEHQKYFK